MNLDRLVRHARPHGALVRSDLVPAVMSKTAWYRAHDTGLLLGIHPGVSRLATRPLTDLLGIEAALAVTPGGMTGGLSSAWLWGAESARQDDVELLLPDGCGAARRLRGVTIHRPTAAVRPVPHRQLWTCDPLRVVLDVAAWHPLAIDQVLTELVVAGRFGISAVRAMLDRERQRGRPGVRRLQQALDDWQLGERPPDSVLERTMAALLARHGLPRAEFQLPVGRYRPDFTFVAERAVLECDGWGDHGKTSEQLDDDHAREAGLNAEGLVVWRYTWRQITQSEAWVARTLRSRIAVRRADLGLDSLE